MTPDPRGAANAARQTVGRVTFEVPDEFLGSGEYVYQRGEAEMIKIEVASKTPGDAEALLATARSTFQGLPTPLSSTSLARADGSPLPVLTGEVPLDAERFKIVVMAIVTPGAKAVAAYWAPSDVDALSFFRQVAAGLFADGEPGADARRVPPGWSRRQVDRLRFALPREWTDPKSIVLGFGSGAELEVTASEPAVPEGVIDRKDDLPRGTAAGATRVGTELVTGPGLSGWTGEWRLAGSSAKDADERIIRKMSVTVAGDATFTAYGRTQRSEASRLENAWRMLRCTLRAAVATDG